MKKTIKLKIDVSKIDKSKLFQGAKGTYLDAVLFLNDEVDKYGNSGMIVQSVTMEEREQGVKGAILGNCKDLSEPLPQSTDTETTQQGNDDLPF